MLKTSILKSGKSAKTEKKCVFMQDIARDLQTGEVAQLPARGPAYKAWSVSVHNRNCVGDDNEALEVTDDIR
ncbi:hypothetical protein JX266_006639 [Neoarthrinium moseri]|nr:hypothetical protein JX266_006639 [Neoarthrinium moseri]